MTSTSRPTWRSRRRSSASVLATLARTVGYGERETYGGLARAIDRPTASRAVGAALGANPLCIVVPCHRVVGSHGALTGYAGGVAAKEYLLDLEPPPDRAPWRTAADEVPRPASSARGRATCSGMRVDPSPRAAVSWGPVRNSASVRSAP